MRRADTYDAARLRGPRVGAGGVKADDDTNRRRRSGLARRPQTGRRALPPAGRRAGHPGARGRRGLEVGPPPRRRHERLPGARERPAGRSGHRRRVSPRTRGQGLRGADSFEAVEEEGRHRRRHGPLAAKPVAADAGQREPGLHLALAVDRPRARRGRRPGRAPHRRASSSCSRPTGSSSIWRST